MLTVLEPCDTEYRVRALLLQPRQGVTSLLIGDIRVPAAASYPHFRSLSLFFLIYSLSLLPLHILSPSLALSLLLGSSLISSLRRPPPPLLHFKWWPCAGAAPRFRQAKERVKEREREWEKKERDGRREEKTSYAVDAKSRLHIPTSGPLSFFSHEHQHVINRINLGPNFLMIAVLMYVNKCSLLTHYRQFAWDTHNQTLLHPTNIYFC